MINVLFFEFNILIYVLTCGIIIYSLIGAIDMSLSYNKLWKLLIDKKMKKKDLMNLASISRGTMAKLGRDENVNTDILVKICVALNCNIGDIVEIVTENK